MTCLATDVYPLPSYVWDDITCDNGNKGSTCTFTPHSPTNITRATCIVSHKGFGYTVAIKRVQLNFKCKYKLPLGVGGGLLVFVSYIDSYSSQEEIQMILSDNCIG